MQVRGRGLRRVGKIAARTSVRPTTADSHPFGRALISPNSDSARSNLPLKSHIASRISRKVADGFPVDLTEGEDAVVAQISHYGPVGNCISGEVARFERRLGRSRNDLDELEQPHLIDRIWQCSHDRRYLREKVGERAHKSISHGGPVIEPMIQIADPCLFLVVASAQCRIKGRDRLSDRRPFLLPISVFGYTRLQASLVPVRARIPYVLIAVCLSEE